MDVWGKHLNRNFSALDSESRCQSPLRLRDSILDDPISSTTIRPTRKRHLQHYSQTQSKTPPLQSASNINLSSSASTCTSNTNTGTGAAAPDSRSIEALRILDSLSGDRGALDVLETLEWREPSLPRDLLRSCAQPQRPSHSPFSLPSKSVSCPISSGSSSLPQQTAPPIKACAPKPFPKPNWANEWVANDEVLSERDAFSTASTALCTPSSSQAVASLEESEEQAAATCEKSKKAPKRRSGERSRSGKALNENFVRLQKKKRFYGLGANARRRHGALGRGGISRFKRRRFWRLTHRSDTEAAGLGPDDDEEEQADENDDEDDDDDEDEQVDVVDEGKKEERLEEESHDTAVELETAGEERAEAESDVADGD